jgi:hypothetical protein
MPRNDDIEEAGPDLRAPHAAQGAPHRLGTVPRAALLTPPEAPADLRAALATIPAEWGRRMFDPASLDTRMAACKLTVKHPEDLLVLRQALFDDLCPSITWILRTSVLEWEYLSAEQKQQQTEMREALDTASLLKRSYSTGSGNFLKTAPASSLIFTRYLLTSLPIPRSVVQLLGPKSFSVTPLLALFSTQASCPWSTLVVKIKKTQESTPRFLKRITEISLLPVDWGLSSQAFSKEWAFVPRFREGYRVDGAQTRMRWLVTNTERRQRSIVRALQDSRTSRGGTPDKRHALSFAPYIFAAPYPRQPGSRERGLLDASSFALWRRNA